PTGGQIAEVRRRAQRARDAAAQAMIGPAADPNLASQLTDLAARLETMADDLPYFGGLPAARRDYDAFTLTARNRFSNRWQLQASYTYAQTIGNYAGVYSGYNNQLDPNITSQFDTPELTLNRMGPLPQDRPHQLKLDGSYALPIGADDTLVFGSSFR